MRTYSAPTLTELHDLMTESLLHGTEDELDMMTNVDSQIHNVIATADSMAWDFDMKNMWLTPSRWTMMVKQYLDPEELDAWIDRVTSKIGTKGRGIAVLRTKIVKPRGGDETGHTNKATRRWGACMLNISYKAKPEPTITLHSRTSYLGYIGALDLTVAWMAGRYLAKEMGIKIEDIRFVWMIEAIQWHHFKSLAYALNHRDEAKQAAYRRLLMLPGKELTNPEKRTILTSPSIRGSRKWLQKVMAEDAAGRTYGDMTYNTFRRIIRRFHTEVHGLEYAQQFEGWSVYKKGAQEGQQKEFFKAYQLLPSTRADSLDFKALGMPITRSYGEPFVGGDEDEDDDE